MADVRFDHATRVLPGLRGRRAARLRPAHRGRGVHGPRRPIGLGQDDRAADARRARGGRCRARSGSATRDVTDLAPKDRDVAMVFQSYALYPYLTVADNIAFPLTMAKVAKAERAQRVAAIAEMLGLTEYPRAQAVPAVWGPASARRDGPRDHPLAERVPHGRAALEPRRAASRPDARRDRLAPGPDGHDDGVRDARPIGGDDARPSRRRAARRVLQQCASPARALRPTRQRRSWRASSGRRR